MMRVEYVAAFVAILVLQGMWLPFFGLLPFKCDGVAYFVLSTVTAFVIAMLKVFEEKLAEHREKEAKRKERGY